MKIKVEVQIEPFPVPNFVTVQKGIATEGGLHNSQPNAYPLDQLDVETLERLCETFRAGLFSKASKKDPKVTMGSSHIEHTVLGVETYAQLFKVTI